MKKAIAATLAIGVLAGCQDQITTPGSLTPGAASFALSAAPAIDPGTRAFPVAANVADHRTFSLRDGAINPGDYICEGSTAIVEWWLDEAYAWIGAEPDLFSIIYVDLFGDYVVQDYALYFETTDQPQYFGYDGEYTNVLRRTDRDARRFWDIYSDDIQLVGMHGTILTDVEKVAAVYELYGNPPEVSAEAAALMREAVLASNVIDGGNHSIFSFNAFAISAPGFIPDKIVMGDGILAGYEALGFEDVAPQAIYAHEFAHHIQYENGYFADEIATSGTQAESTRYTELMADAMSAYYLTHKRGAALNKHRVADFLEVFYQIGDCGFASDGHHGTPNQRMAAAQFGFQVADQAQKKGHILTSEAFYQLFLDAYPELIAPDNI